MGIAPSVIARVEPVAYRRILRKEESKLLWDQLEICWQVTGGYYYATELMQSSPPRAVPFRADVFESKIPSEILREILSEHGIQRVFELFEFDGEPQYEIDLALMEPAYGSSGELYCTSAEIDWLIYASHENEITVAGGWLIEAIQAKWST